MAKSIDNFAEFVGKVSKWVNWVAGVGLVAMLCLTVADIIAIKFFSWPIPGAIEIVAFFGVVVSGFAIAYNQQKHGHIQVDFLVIRFPERLQSGIKALVLLLALGLFAILAWRSYDFGRVLQTTGEVSMTQRIPFYPFVYTIVFCSITVCAVLVMQFLQSLVKVLKK